MVNIKENNENKILEIYTPYNENFVSDIKKSVSGAKWNPSLRCWTAPSDSDSKEIVHQLLSTHYGYTPDCKGITVQITAKEDLYGDKDSVRFGSWPVCRATGRDSGARVCDNVLLISGKIKSGGSVKNWSTEVEEGTVLKVKNIPEGILEKVDPERWEYEIIEEKSEKEKLLEEKESLLKRLAEIEKELEGVE